MSPSAQEIVAELSQNYNSGISKSYVARLENLQSFYRMMQCEEKRILQALDEDLGKTYSEGFMTEILPVLNACADAIHNLQSWMEVENADMGRLSLMLDMKATIEKVPHGVTLIVGAWNYPIQLTLLPVIGALAGGNVVVVKPSEMAEKSSHLMAEMIAKYMNPKVIRVIEGGVPEITELLKQPLDFIFFTGSTAVGRLMYKVAAEKMIPIVLELGGKSPTIIDGTVDFDIAATRIMWGKTLNSGQTCIAPDYVIAVGLTTAQINQFTIACKKALTLIYKKSENLQDCKEYSRIINVNHHNRLSKLVSDQKKVPGCKVEQIGLENSTTKFFPPTIITGLNTSKSHQDPILSQELFGPILPIIQAYDIQEAIQFVNKVAPTPLALYIFSKETLSITALKNGINAGGVVINDVIIHCAIEGLPFGGVGQSGLGMYHGPANFSTFTRKQANLSRSTYTDLTSFPRYIWFLGDYESSSTIKWIKYSMQVPVSDNWIRGWEYVRILGGLSTIKMILMLCMGIFLGTKL